MRDWLSHRAAATPDAEALVVARSGETLTYADLDAHAGALAGRLAGLGLAPGDHLAAVLPNRPGYVALVHAAMRLGVRLVPLSDRLTAHELGPQLAAADATAVICDGETEAVVAEAALSDEDADDGWGTVDGFRPARVADDGESGTDGDGDDDGPRDGERNENADDARPDVGDGPTVVSGGETGLTRGSGGAGATGGSGVTRGTGGSRAPGPGTDRSIPVVSLDEPSDDRVVDIDAAPDGPVPSVRWGRGDPLLMLYTSGSTGDPKLVTLTMGNVLASATASAFRLGVLPDDRYLATLSLHHTGGIMPVYRATLYGTSVVLREGFDAGGTADDIRRYGASGVSLVPTMLRRMLDARGTLADCLRVVLLGGAPASDSLIERCRNFSVPVHPTWGMTEAASQLATARPDEAFDHVGTVGRPLFWTDLAVRDDDGTDLPRGETGELVVSGPSITPGYYDDPEANEAAFTDDGALRTGDVGYRDEDGFVYVLNRLDDRILTGGENVDPGEVAAVLREHPRVEDAAVVGLPDDEWGERVAALVVPADGAEGDAPGLSKDDLESFCRERLAGFKLPRTVAFADDLPRTVSGTVERQEVRAILETVREREGDGDGVDGANVAGAVGVDGENGDEDSDGSGGTGDDDTGSSGQGDDGPSDGPSNADDEADPTDDG